MLGMFGETREDRMNEVRARRDAHIASGARDLCRSTKTECLARIKAGELLSTPEEMTGEFYQLLAHALLHQYYAEWWGALQYKRATFLAPTPQADAAFKKIVVEEFGHAKMIWHGIWNDGDNIPGPLNTLKVDPLLFFADTPEEQVSLLRIFQHPGFRTWAEVVMYGHLQDRSAALQLADFAQGPYLWWRMVLERIDREEQFHIRHGEQWIRKLAKTSEGKRELQVALSKWFPHAMDVFGRPGDTSKTDALYREYGLKKLTNDQARAEFVNQVQPLIQECGLELPHWEDFIPSRPF